MSALKNIRKSLVAAFVAGLLASAGAQATIATYSSSTAFSSDLTNITTTNYQNAALNGSGGTTIGFSGGSFVGSYLDITNNTSTTNAGGTDLVGNFFFDGSGAGTLQINFTNPIYGFALSNYGMNSGSKTATPSVVFAYGSGAATVVLPGYLSYFNSGTGAFAPNASPSYEGFASMTPFNSATITVPNGNLVVQSISIATGLSSTVLSAGSLVSGSTVPEPGSIALLMLGGLGFIGAGRKFKNNGNTNGRSAA
jgi:hypothetical protein